MAYVKQNFKSGETLYALQLNAMDKQIAANEAATVQLQEGKANQADLAKTADKLNAMDKQVAANDAATVQLNHRIDYAEPLVFTTKNMKWELGSINSTTGLDNANSGRIRCGYIDFSEIISIIASNDARINILAYNNAKNLLGNSDWLAKNATMTASAIRAMFPDVSYIRIIVMATNTDFGENIAVNVLTALDKISDFKTDVLRKTSETHRFDSKFQTIAYATIGVAPINTKEHFLYCAKNGFDGLKCDVRITSDNKLVLCHDKGFTYDSNGRITTFDSENCTLIRNMTYSEVMALEHSSEYNGHFCHPTDLDTFLMVCKRYGKIPYITVRGATDSADDGELAPTVSQLVIDAIKKFNVVKDCIVNSFDYTILMMIRSIEPEIYLSQVFTPYNATLRSNAMHNAIANDLFMLALFYADTTHNYNSMVADADVMAFIEECSQRNIRIFGAQSTTDDELDNIAMLGFSGSQHKRPL